MAVILETSLGDIFLDLYVDKCPKTCENFLKLCKIKYYNNVIFHNVQKDFIAQTGDPDGSGRGGSSIWGIMYGEQARFFDDEISKKIKHSKRGTVAMANTGGSNTNGSQFYITLGDDLTSLDEKYTIFGELPDGEDGEEALKKINAAFCDNNDKPIQNIRIRHTVVIDDPFPDPPMLKEHIPDRSPEAKPDKHDVDRIADYENALSRDEGKTDEQIDEELKAATAKSQAEVLTMIGDLPHAEVTPDDTDLFVCKLNPVTTSEDLETVFSQFGEIVSCEVVKDWKTGDSLQYAFIEFEEREACERAYFKMDNALIDDRRIHVDFSQSVSKKWSAWKKGDRRKQTGFAGNAVPRRQKREDRKDDSGGKGHRTRERNDGGGGRRSRREDGRRDSDRDNRDHRRERERERGGREDRRERRRDGEGRRREHSRDRDSRKRRRGGRDDGRSSRDRRRRGDRDRD
mmetsp:Transcript_21489/g.34746  ORF Transcript_21489/g.34746 Transcript_21489/m.34746 type:complete len:458 (+) Transcript_21489:44-1417(+)